MSITSKLKSLLPKRTSVEQRAARKQAGADVRRQIQIDKADVAGVSHEQVTKMRGNSTFGI